MTDIKKPKTPRTRNPRSKERTETTIPSGDRPEHVAKPSVSKMDTTVSDGTKEKTEFSAVNADRIVEAFESLHTVKGVATALGIHRSTIQSWMRKYPDFRERIESAQRRYYRSVDAENIAFMRSNLKDICEKGWTVQRRTKKQVIVNGEIVELITDEITVAPPPDWAFQRVLGGNDETLAIKTLATAGWIPDELAMEILEKIDSASGDVKDIFRKRFNLEDL
jgi:hypothetical protein